MKQFFTKKRILIIGDILLIPAMIACERLSDFMLSRESVCQWMALGGKCVTCGGTHFVNSILNGNIIEAFNHNQFLFFLAIFMAFSYVLLNLHWLFDLDFAKKILSKLYSIPSLIIWVSVMLLFFFGRNIPLFLKVIEYFY